MFFLGVRCAWVSFVIVTIILVGGCAIQERDTKGQLSAAGLIATPPAHYSTQKARYLGEKYQQKLNRLIEMIIANPKTSKLQFANNLGSAGGMGFFTHSAVKTPDERFLEVVLGTGENIDAGEYSGKVARLFSAYGRELLLILASDLEIYNDRELSGYGLNFTWRTAGSRITTERAIVYFPKEKVRAFLKEELGENTLLAEAVIFVMESEGHVNRLSFRAPEPAPDVRAPIQEQVLAPRAIKEKADVEPLVARGDAKSTKTIEPGTNADETSAREKKRPIPSSQMQTSPNPVTPRRNLATKEEIVPDPKAGAFVGDKAEPVGRGPASESATESAGDLMPAVGVIERMETTSGALQSVRPEVDAKSVESKFEPQETGTKTFEASKLVELAEKRDQLESASNSIDSQLRASISELRPTEFSPVDVGFHTPPVPGSTETQLSPTQQAKPGSESKRPDEVASIPKMDLKSADTKATAPVLIKPSKQQNAAELDTFEQQPVLGHAKRIEDVPEMKSLVKPVPKALEGYIIQMSFQDRSEARRWADTFEQRGYAVSITEAGTAGSLRVRIGNFRLRDDAERQLKGIREGGLVGVILNLPQPYRPNAHSSLP